jgi:hypothetical protein
VADGRTRPGVHDVPTDEAATIVELLSDRTLPVIWEVGDRKRVLRTDLSMKDKTLLLLHATPGAVPEAELVRWVEHANPSVHRRTVLRSAHRARLVEYDEEAKTVEISPLGTGYVEDNLPPQV